MTAATWKKLKRLGYDVEFIKSICHFRKDNAKRYEMRISDKDKNYICSACFNTKEELEDIISLLYGFHYTLIDHKEVKRLGTGIVDNCCFDVMECKYEEGVS